jgi:hypothetical protein
MAKGTDKSGDDKIPIDDPRVSGYLRQLENSLKQCAHDVEARPDAFLWNARRSIEAMLRVLHLRGAVSVPIDAPLDKLIDALDRNLVPQNARNAFHGVRADGNFGAHVQGPEAPEYGDFVKRCRLTLRQVVEWFYKQPDMPRTPDEVNRALAVLAGDAPTFLEEEQEKAAAAVKRDLDAALASARREIALARRNLEATERENTRLQRELDLERTRRSPASSVNETTAGAPASSLPAPVLIGAVLVVLVLVGTAAAVRGCAPEPSTPTAGATPPPARPSSTTVGSGSAVAPAGATVGATVTEGPGAPDTAAPAAASAAAGAAPAEPSAAPLRSCPDDMIALLGGTVDFGEPYRRPWLKAPRTSGLHAPVAPFCLDQHAVRATALWSGRRASEGERGFASTGCNPARAGSKSAVNCVTHTEAETWCKERGARLPSLVEWELVASRGADKRLELPGDTFEWVADPFPSPAWDRGPPQKCDGAPCFLAREGRADPSPGGARFSWMRYPDSKWLGTRTFRCALDRR